MDIDVPVAKTAVSPKPAVGADYLTKNWDDTIERVKVVSVMGDTVVMEYDDGVRHRVSALYFFEGLGALLVQ
jgi:hypothetical protein